MSFILKTVIDVFFPYSICILLLLLQEDSVNHHQSKILRRFILDSELKNQIAISNEKEKKIELFEEEKDPCANSSINKRCPRFNFSVNL